MERESVAFTAPVVGLLLGALGIVFGVYQGGLTAFTYVGIAVGFLSIVGLVVAVAMS